ncbi:MAG: aspartate aminotransferase family protein [Acidobacteriota bacterium]|nr:aspartate aminotransferase family protein [Acidobacteriota bacterium]MDE3044153.1 aspartate aminotransferase family protein [Acidobacteriota bacterium]
MFDYDEKLGEVVFDYCRARLSEDPVPLDFGSSLDIHPEALRGLISAQGEDPARVLEIFRTTLAPAVVSIDSPGFLAFIPNAPTKNSLLFDMVVACSGLNGTSWLESSGVVVAENQALEFLAERAGLPEGAGGAFVSGGSIGNLSSLTVARDVGRAKHPEIDPRRVRFAISADAHSSIGKALHVLDVEALIVETEDHRFTRSALEAALANDPHPENVVGVVATAGTTNAGIVDDLEGLGTFARAHDLWFHVDGAYGGAAIFSPSHRELLRGLRHADSFIVDPHKWLFAPLDCCALLYREPRLARKVLAQQASYLDVLHEGDDDHFDWNPSDFGIQLSRRARGLPFWFSLATNGVAAYEDAVERAITLAEATERFINEAEHVEMVRPSSLSIVLFRRLGWDAERYNEWSKWLLREQIAFVTPSKWEGETVARLAFLHPNTTEAMVHQILDSMRD